MELESLIRSAAGDGASVLHLEAGMPAAVRVRGDLQFSGEPIPPEAGLESFSSDRNKMNGFLKIFLVGGISSLLIATSFCGCVTKSQARAQAQAAYLAGQKDALAKMAAARAGHRHRWSGGTSQVPWVEGLTLSQAIATANYIGRHNPKEHHHHPPGRTGQLQSQGFAQRPRGAAGAGRYHYHSGVVDWLNFCQRERLFMYPPRRTFKLECFLDGRVTI